MLHKIKSLLKDKEFLNFIKFYLQSPRVEFLYFFINLFFQKFLRKYQNNTHGYPDEVKNVVRSIRYPEILKWSLPFKEISSHHKEEQMPSLKAIKLASEELKLNATIEWEHPFSDDEDTESLHRWNWLLHTLSQSDQNEFYKLYFWGQKHIDSWFKHNPSPQKSLLWESYTVGERICNSIIFFYLIGFKPSDSFSEGIKSFIKHLIDHLEYRGTFTGNHIFNNARAIFIAGCSFGVESWRRLGELIILREIKHLATKDGFLREGSSHYHFLFTRWVLEIISFAELTQQQEFIRNLRPYAEKLIEKCWFFLIHNPETQDWNLPLIGDISPDFSPNWLINLPWSDLAISIYKPENIPIPTRNTGWANLFGDIAKASHCKGNNYTNKNGFTALKDSGWCRINFNKSDLIFRAETTSTPSHASHAHCDIGAFYLYLNGYPLLVDAGRLNYKRDAWGEFGMSAQAHNTLCIDELGPSPIQWLKYPSCYSQAKTDVSIVEAQEGLDIKINYDGYQRLPKPLKVSRSLFLRDEKLEIEDEIGGKGFHKIELFFHFGPNIQIQRNSTNSETFNITGRFGNATITFETVKGTSYIDSFEGDEEPLGWYISEYGKKEPTVTIRRSIFSNVPVKLKSCIRWNYSEA